MIGKAEKRTIMTFTTRGCSFSVPKKRCMASGPGQGHQCFCVFMSLHFMCSLQGSVVFGLMDSKEKTNKCGVLDCTNWLKACLWDSPECKEKMLNH